MDSIPLLLDHCNVDDYNPCILKILPHNYLRHFSFFIGLEIQGYVGVECILHISPYMRSLFHEIACIPFRFVVYE